MQGVSTGQHEFLKTRNEIVIPKTEFSSQHCMNTGIFNQSTNSDHPRPSGLSCERTQYTGNGRAQTHSFRS